MSTEFWIQIVVYGVSIGSFAGIILTKINYLEKKQDKHNCFIERLYKVEQKQEADRADIERHEHLIERKQ